MRRIWLIGGLAGALLFMWLATNQLEEARLVAGSTFEIANWELALADLYTAMIGVSFGLAMASLLSPLRLSGVEAGILIATPLLLGMAKWMWLAGWINPFPDWLWVVSTTTSTASLVLFGLAAVLVARGFSSD